MAELWIVRVEMTVQPEDFASGNTVGFMNAVIWADAPELAAARLSRYLATFDWHVVSVEDISIACDDLVYQEKMQEMIDQARVNPEAIVLGDFHSYKVN